MHLRPASCSRRCFSGEQRLGAGSGAGVHLAPAGRRRDVWSCPMAGAAQPTLLTNHDPVPKGVEVEVLTLTSSKAAARKSVGSPGLTDHALTPRPAP